MDTVSSLALFLYVKSVRHHWYLSLSFWYISFLITLSVLLALYQKARLVLRDTGKNSPCQESKLKTSNMQAMYSTSLNYLPDFSSFLIAEYCFTVFINHNFFVHSPVMGHLGCFQILAAMDTGVHTAFWYSVFFFWPWMNAYMWNHWIIWLFYF